MKSKEMDQLLSCVLEILKLMTEAGAEIYRIEESATRIFETYVEKKAEVYATTSNIIVSIETDDGSVKTHMRRIDSIAINIERIHVLNALVRKITTERPAPEEIRAELEKISHTPRYPKWLNIIFYGIIAAAFYFFFGGRSIPDCAFSFGVGIGTGLITKGFDRIKVNKFLVKFACSFTACMLTFGLHKIGWVTHVDAIIIGNIMTLIPGIGLTNSMRDLFVGDSISGVLRLIEAMLLAVAIACGYIVTTFIFGGVIV